MKTLYCSECEETKNIDIFSKVHKNKWCKQCISEQNEKNKQYSKDELQKCLRCPKKCLKNDPTFLLDNGKYGKTCKKSREEKSVTDKEYKKRKFEEDPEGYKTHLAKSSNSSYHKKMKSEDFRIKRQGYRKMWIIKNPEKIKKQTKQYNASTKGKLQKYKDNCKYGNKIWSFSDEDALEMMDMKCFYCNEKDQRGYGGLDRMDSSDREYRKDKCVPACKICNYMKKSWTQESFILLCGHISTFNNLKGGSLIYNIMIDRKRTYYNTYKSKSDKKNIIFEITKENCYLCGVSNSKNHKNGIDRMNPTLGYTYNNCKACCATCNYLKDRYSKEEILDKCVKIYKNCKDKFDLNIDILEKANAI